MGEQRRGPRAATWRQEASRWGGAQIREARGQEAWGDGALGPCAASTARPRSRHPTDRRWVFRRHRGRTPAAEREGGREGSSAAKWKTKEVSKIIKFLKSKAHLKGRCPRCPCGRAQLPDPEPPPEASVEAPGWSLAKPRSAGPAARRAGKSGARSRFALITKHKQPGRRPRDGQSPHKQTSHC